MRVVENIEYSWEVPPKKRLLINQRPEEDNVRVWREMKAVLTPALVATRLQLAYSADVML